MVDENPGELLTEPRFPTGKSHVSYSELSNWRACSFRHKLAYIDKIEIREPSPFLTFGTALHAACENYLKTRVMNVDIATVMIKEDWDKYWGKYGFCDKARWLGMAAGILGDFPKFLNKTFPQWEYVAAEEQLQEAIDGHEGMSFKGYIDGIIKAPDKQGRVKYWIIDYKTCSWGWHRKKKQDDMVLAQLRLYKHYWAQKHGIPLKDIRCGFILMKRDGKNGNRCELFTVSMGDTTQKRVLKVVDNMITSVNRGIFIKNRNACKFCAYKDTVYCP